ncbi:MAG: hypothetical protein U9R79_11410 [Armatimonadota bacterium]|nr:hypothetical protein [Armatimonadota bacterium]
MMRHSGIAALLAILAGQPGLAQEPIDVGSRKQLFIDDLFIAESSGVTLTMNPPVKRERVDVGPMWQDNPRVDFGAVFYDPKAPPEQRYKRTLLKGEMKDTETGGLYIQYSADRTNWTEVPQRVFPFWPDGENNMFYDPHKDIYVAHFRQWIPAGDGTDRMMRSVGRLEVEDPLQPWPIPEQNARVFMWGQDRLPAPGPGFQTVLATDERDPGECDFYDHGIFRYPWADRVYLAFPVLYRHFPPPPQGELANDGLVDVQLATSRDGVTWRRFRGPYIDLGISGEDPDGACIYISRGLMRNGDQLHQWYAGYPQTHGHWAGAEGNPRFNGMVVQRLDGFVSADADYEGGELITPPIVFEGAHLELNIDCSAAGDCRVEVQAADGQPIEGFALEHADLIRGNFIRKLATWRDGDPDLSALAGRPVRLRFVMHAAKLYAFQFQPDSDEQPG